MKIAVAGDWHGNVKHAVAMVKQAKQWNCDRMLHVGDFGYQFAPHFLNQLKSELGEMELWFVDGNHENFYKLYSTYSLTEDGRRELRPNIFHLPRGYRWTWGKTRFLALGGAVSVDKEFRTPHSEWWPEEEITIEDVLNVCNVDDPTADVMICHDVPDGVYIPGIEGNPYGFPEESIARAERHRRILRNVVDVVKPHQIYSGHYHVRHSAFLHGEDYDTAVDILHCDGMPAKANMTILRIEDDDQAEA